MAVYFTDDFADYPTDWTERIKTPSTAWSVSGGDLSLGAPGASDWIYLSWDDVDGDSTRADFDILVVYNASSVAQRNYMVIGRGAGTDESATNYAVSIATNSIRTHVCNATDTPTQISTATPTVATGTDYWIRFRVNGTAIKAKIWSGAAGDEPGGVASDSNWNCSGTDSAVTAAGWVGASAYSSVVSQGVIKQLGIGTNGDWGPSAAGADTRQPFLSKSLAAVTRASRW